MCSNYCDVRNRNRKKLEALATDRTETLMRELPLYRHIHFFPYERPTRRKKKRDSIIQSIPWFIIMITGLSFTPDFVSTIRAQRCGRRRCRLCTTSSSARGLYQATHHGGISQHHFFTPLRLLYSLLTSFPNVSFAIATTQENERFFIKGLCEPHKLPSTGRKVQPQGAKHD